MSWHQDAACRTIPTHVFYPDKGVNAQPAKTVCARCPVRAQCEAEGAGEPHGIWGGQAPTERGTSLHNRGEAHRLYDVAVCPTCDARFWTHKRATNTGVLCPACRIDDEDVA